MKMTSNPSTTGRRWFLKSLVLGVAACAVAFSVMAATGRYSSVILTKVVQVDNTHYDLYARASGQYQVVEFETRGAWGTLGRRLPDGTWTARLFGHPGMGWGARTLVSGRPDAVAYSTLP